jgi:hypothetical protein
LKSFGGQRLQNTQDVNFKSPLFGGGGNDGNLQEEIKQGELFQEQDNNFFNFVQYGDDPQILAEVSPFTQDHTNNLRLTSTVGRHFVPASQNPFQVFTQGMVKIGELLKQQN